MAPCWLSFGASGAPGHASGSSMCTKGGLDPSWEHFGSELVAQRLEFASLGLNLGSILVAFEGPQAPRHASGGSLCPRGGLDPFWDGFGEPKWSQNACKNQ